MQSSIFYSLKKNEYAKSLGYLLKLVLLLAFCFVVVRSVHQQQFSWQLALYSLQGLYQGPAARVGLPVIVLLLVPLNWVLESAKWKCLLPASGSLTSNVRAVLSSVMLGMVLPRPLAEYVGRQRFTRMTSKKEYLRATLHSRFIQAALTYFLGLISLILVGGYLTTDLFGVLLVLSLVVLMVGILLFFKHRLLLRWVGKGAWLRNKFPILCQEWPARQSDLREVVFIGSLRYLVFIIQYCLLLISCGVALPAMLMLGAVGLTYMIKSSLPALNILSDLGAREFSAMIVFGALGVPEVQVVVASLLLWGVNLLLPALLGGLIYWFGVQKSTV